jgi:predicted Zn-dependent protease
MIACMNRKLLIGGALVCALGLASAGAQPASAVGRNDLPVLGDASSSLISPELEKKIGQDFLRQVHANLRTVDDPILKYYVERQLADLAAHSALTDRSLSPVLIDSPDVNAFAAPGGVVGINLGLMLHAEDVNEYAAVIAHELAHLSQRHFARGIEEQRAQTIPTIASVIAAILLGAVGGADAGLAALSTAQAAAISNQLRYSRARETEADRIGLETMVEADLDPQGMARMFERMQRAYRYTRKPPEFLLTHPLSETRISDARSQALRYPQRTYPPDRAYQLMRARAVVHYADSPQAAVQRFEKDVRDDPENPAARYGLALALSAAGEHGQAIALAEQLQSGNPHDILYLATLAEALTNAGETDQSIPLLQNALRHYPDNPPLSMLYADALVGAERYAAAETVLEQLARTRRQDVDVWYQLAEVAGLAGNIVGVHLARAQYFELHGAYHQAIQHLEYASRLASRTNEQLHARLDQQIIDLRMAMRERG